MEREDIYRIIKETFDDKIIKCMKTSFSAEIEKLHVQLEECGNFDKILSILYELVSAYKTLDLFYFGERDDIHDQIERYEKAYRNANTIYMYLNGYYDAEDKCDDKIEKAYNDKKLEEHVFDDEEDAEYSDDINTLKNSCENTEKMNKDKEAIEQMKNAGIYNINDTVTLTHNTTDFQYDCNFTHNNLSFSNPLSNEKIEKAIQEDFDKMCEKMQEEDGKEYEFVNQPTHYNIYDIPVIDMMEKIWGPDDTAKWCKMTAWKYRQRMGTKPGENIQKDLDKEKWYLDKYDEITRKNPKTYKKFLNRDEARMVDDCFLKRLNILAELDENVKYDQNRQKPIDVPETTYNKMLELADEYTLFMQQYGRGKCEWPYQVVKKWYKSIK